MEKRLAAVVNSRISAGHEADNRARNENAPFSPRSHVAAYPPNKVERTDDIGVHDPPGFSKILFEKVPAESTAGIRQEQVDRPPVGSGIKPIDSLHRSEIRFDSLNLDTHFAQLP